MTKENIIYVCENCGAESLKWSGRCSICEQWNTLVEVKKPEKSRRALRSKGDLGLPLKLAEIKIGEFKHMPTHINEFDRVLGGGIIPGSLLLLAGEPGVGKSTLLLTLANQKENCLYISGEESAAQIKLRADRLNVKNKSLLLLAETDLDYIINIIEEKQPSLVIVDSIQAMYDDHLPSTPGSIVQVREGALRLQAIAKAKHIPIMIIGHITKEGVVAGPRTLEHLVDVVLYLEGDRFHGTRILRGSKNRFGTTDEVGLFKMEASGLVEIDNPSELFLAERHLQPGSVVTATIEGTRPILLEIQALTSPTVFGYPRRAASGFDVNRLQLILAVLSNRVKLPLQNLDVYINVVGGFYIKEPAVDLAVAMAVISAYKNKNIDKKLCIWGEIGLGGEIRRVTQEERRYHEAKRIGYEQKVSSSSIQDLMKKLWPT